MINGNKAAAEATKAAISDATKKDDAKKNVTVDDKGEGKADGKSDGKGGGKGDEEPNGGELMRELIADVREVKNSMGEQASTHPPTWHAHIRARIPGAPYAGQY